MSIDRGESLNNSPKKEKKVYTTPKLKLRSNSIFAFQPDPNYNQCFEIEDQYSNMEHFSNVDNNSNFLSLHQISNFVINLF
jgi:hypothetical protein